MIMPWDECHRTLLISQHWFRLWHGDVRQQAITWANVDPYLCFHMASPGHNGLIRIHSFEHQIVSVIGEYAMESAIFSCDQAALQMVFSVCLSVRPSVCPSHLFDYVPIIGSSWNFQELLPMTNVRSMQKVKVRGQRSRSQRSQPNLTVSGL